VRVNSALVVNTLANGGSNSSIGASANSAANLVFNGGTLKYVGTGSSTDRLFTIGPVGATLDSSGSGAVNFTNVAGTIATTDAAPATGSLNTNGPITSGTQNAQVITTVSDTSNLAVGMVVTASNGSLLANTTITGIGLSSNNVSNCLGISLPAQVSAANISTTLTFTNQNRNLNLTGSNALNNLIAPTLTDSTLGKLGVVKSGAGKWVLAGNNTYTGTTTVTGGTLELAPVSQAPLTSNAGGADIQHGQVIFDYQGPTPGPTINGLLATSHSNNGFNNTTSQIRSTTATSSLGLGMYDNGSSAVTVAYTYYGDANDDGTVNALDFNALATNFGTGTNKLWYQGDFDYSGTVNTSDFVLLSNNFGKSLTIASAPPIGSLGVLVPEPAMLMPLLTLGLAWHRARRRRD
jgi:fibronectin-binding autotransporter adhesin